MRTEHTRVCVHRTLLRNYPNALIIGAAKGRVQLKTGLLKLYRNSQKHLKAAATLRRFAKLHTTKNYECTQV